MDAWRIMEEFFSDPVNLIVVAVGFIIGIILILKVVQQLYRIIRIKYDKSALIFDRIQVKKPGFESF